MIKVIEHGKKDAPREAICRSCGCKLTYEKTDMHIDRDGNYVICPDCGHLIGIGPWL